MLFLTGKECRGCTGMMGVFIAYAFGGGGGIKVARGQIRRSERGGGSHSIV